MEQRRRKIQALPKDEFPGYPMYAPEEDIMFTGKRVTMNVEEALQNATSAAPVRKTETTDNDVEMPEGAEDKIKPENEADVTADDLEALGPKDLSLDMGDDEELKHRTMPVDFSGKDLDIPGSELDDNSEEIGSEDEENNSYSLGGDNHEDLEESRS